MQFNMWNVIEVKDSDVYVLFENKNEFLVCASDLITVWTKSWSRSQFIDCLKTSNPCLEMNDTDLVAKGILTLQNLNEAKKVETSIGSNGQLSILISRPYQYPFRIKLELQEGSKELFFTKITLPLLKTVNDLARSQTELCELLKRKDEEINEYKEEGGRIALRHLKTPKFNQAEHLNKYTTLNTHFSFDEFPSSTLEKNVEASNVMIKQEPDEPHSLNIDPPKHDIKEEIKTEIKREPQIVSSQEVSPKKKRKKLPV